jgi:hypothetical protein
MKIIHIPTSPKVMKPVLIWRDERTTNTKLLVISSKSVLADARDTKQKKYSIAAFTLQIQFSQPTRLFTCCDRN